MNNHKDIYNTIDAFLKGDLHGSELREFEAALLQNNDLALEVKKARALHNLVLQNRLLDIKQLAMQEEARLNNQKLNNKRGLWGGMLLLLTLVTIALLVFINKETTPAKLAINNPIVEPEVSNGDSLPIQNTGQLAITDTTEKHYRPGKIEQTTNTPKSTIDKSKINLMLSDTVPQKTTLENENIQPTFVPKEPKEKTTELVAGSKIENINPCKSVQLNVQISTTATCLGSSEGKIETTNFVGGSAPYKQTLFRNGKEVHNYSELEAGNYELVVSDSKNCLQTFSAHIAEKSCPINDYFNPNYGEVWNIPVTDKSGKLTIYSKAGTPIYQMNLKNNIQNSWNGKDKYERLEAGYYIFVIEYEDGMVLKGSVTITL